MRLWRDLEAPRVEDEPLGEVVDAESKFREEEEDEEPLPPPPLPRDPPPPPPLPPLPPVSDKRVFLKPFFSLTMVS